MPKGFANQITQCIMKTRNPAKASGGRPYETGSRNMAATQKNQLFDPSFLFTPSDTFSLGRTVLPQYKTSQTKDRQTDRQTTHCAKGTTDSMVGQKRHRQTDRQTNRRHIVPKARPIVRSAKNWPRVPRNR